MRLTKMVDVEIERLTGGTWIFTIATEYDGCDIPLSPQEMMTVIEACETIKEQVAKDVIAYPEDEPYDEDQEELDEIEEYIKELSEKKNEILKKREAKCSNMK